MPGVPTFTGEIGADDLGLTLIHEHVFVGHQELDLNLPHPEWDETAAIDTAVRGFAALHEVGVRTVVDLTVPGLGRDVARVREVARRSDVRLLAATGWYTADVLPAFFHTHGPAGSVGGEDPLETLFRGDIVEGVAGTGIRAAALKVVTDTPGFNPDVARVWRTAALVQRETGVPWGRNRTCVLTDKEGTTDDQADDAVTSGAVRADQ